MSTVKDSVAASLRMRLLSDLVAAAVANVGKYMAAASESTNSF